MPELSVFRLLNIIQRPWTYVVVGVFALVFSGFYSSSQLNKPAHISRAYAQSLDLTDQLREQIRGQLESQLEGITGSIDELTSLQDQLGSIGDLSSSLSELGDITDALDSIGSLGDIGDITSQLEGLTDISGSLGDLGSISDTLSGLGDISEITSALEGVEGAGDIISQLEGLGDLQSQLGSLGDLSSITDSLGSLGDISSLTDGLSGLGDLGGLSDTLGSLGDIGDITSALDGLGDLGSLTDSLGDFDSILGQLDSMDINQLTNLSDSLGALGNIDAQLSGLTDSLGALGDLGDLTDTLGSLGDLSSLTDSLGSLGDLGDLSSALGDLGDLSSLTDSLDALGDLSSLTDSLGALGDLSSIDFSAISDLAALGDLGDRLSALGDLSSLTDSLGALGDLGSLTDALGSLSDLGDLTDMLGSLSDLGSISDVLGSLGDLSSIADLESLTSILEAGALGELLDGALGDLLGGLLGGDIEGAIEDALGDAVASYICPGSCCVGCWTVFGAHASTQASITALHTATREYITEMWERHKSAFIEEFYFKHHILWGMMNMAEQLTTAGMQQVAAIGAFIDAKQQMETQRLLQELQAEALKRYTPDVAMCTIGTMTRALSPSQHAGEIVSFTVTEYVQDRQMQNKSVASSHGELADRASRLKSFQENFCNQKDNNDNLELLCETDAPERSVNADVNYTRTVSLPKTIDIDVTDGTVTTAGAPEEHAIFAMANNLFGQQLVKNITPGELDDEENRDIALDLRSLTAKRNVAATSFNAIVGMKARGTEKSADMQKYLVKMMESMGVDEDNTLALYGERPSYYAQMEILSKKMYQRPEFYTDLYGSPANVERKGATIEAIRLMQNMDMFKSQLRQEALLAIILEASLNEPYVDVQNRISGAAD